MIAFLMLRATSSLPSKQGLSRRFVVIICADVDIQLPHKIYFSKPRSNRLTYITT